MLTQDRLKELFNYNQDTGEFTYKVNRATNKTGDVAGCLDHKYLRIRIDNKIYYCHRLAWLYMTGDWPKLFIDHIDMNCANNKWNNLRQCTNAENLRNTKPPVTNKSGIKGVRWHKQAKKLVARCKIDNVDYHLGLFESKENAAHAHQLFAKEKHGEFYRGV